MTTSAEYIWSGGEDTHTDLRSKTRTLSIPFVDVKLNYVELNERFLKYIPKWNFDGSSTDQADADNDTEIVLQPVALCWDPFRKNTNLLVLCDCYFSNGSVHPSNKRSAALKMFQKHENAKPWFGLEQEYVILDPSHGKRPFGWPRITEPDAQGKYYCGNGHNTVFRRDILEAHYQACLYAKLGISGYNAEVMPGQYEFQIGPVEGIAAADQLILARFILLRLAEHAELTISYSPKPMKGDWNGSGLHHNFSTKRMREENGYEEIQRVINTLEKLHVTHMRVYGKDNDQRLTGKHETSSLYQFTWGVGTRNTSVRIPNDTYKEKRGYFEDRRPAANVNPYLTTAALVNALAPYEGEVIG